MINNTHNHSDHTITSKNLFIVQADCNNLKDIVVDIDTEDTGHCCDAAIFGLIVSNGSAQQRITQINLNNCALGGGLCSPCPAAYASATISASVLQSLVDQNSTTDCCLFTISLVCEVVTSNTFGPGECHTSITNAAVQISDNGSLSNVWSGILDTNPATVDLCNSTYTCDPPCGPCETCNQGICEYSNFGGSCDPSDLCKICNNTGQCVLDPLCECVQNSDCAECHTCNNGVCTPGNGEIGNACKLGGTLYTCQTCVNGACAPDPNGLMNACLYILNGGLAAGCCDNAGGCDPDNCKECDTDTECGTCNECVTGSNGVKKCQPKSRGTKCYQYQTDMCQVCDGAGACKPEADGTQCPGSTKDPRCSQCKGGVCTTNNSMFCGDCGICNNGYCTPNGIDVRLTCGVFSSVCAECDIGTDYMCEYQDGDQVGDCGVCAGAGIDLEPIRCGIAASNPYGCQECVTYIDVNTFEVSTKCQNKSSGTDCSDNSLSAPDGCQKCKDGSCEPVNDGDQCADGSDVKCRRCQGGRCGSTPLNERCGQYPKDPCLSCEKDATGAQQCNQKTCKNADGTANPCKECDKYGACVAKPDFEYDTCNDCVAGALTPARGGECCGGTCDHCVGGECKKGQGAYCDGGVKIPCYRCDQDGEQRDIYNADCQTNNSICAGYCEPRVTDADGNVTCQNCLCQKFVPGDPNNWNCPPDEKSCLEVPCPSAPVLGATTTTTTCPAGTSPLPQMPWTLGNCSPFPGTSLPGGGGGGGFGGGGGGGFGGGGNNNGGGGFGGGGNGGGGNGGGGNGGGGNGGGGNGGGGWTIQNILGNQILGFGNQTQTTQTQTTPKSTIETTLKTTCKGCNCPGAPKCCGSKNPCCGKTTGPPDCCGNTDPCCGVTCSPDADGCAYSCKDGNCEKTDPCCGVECCPQSGSAGTGNGNTAEISTVTGSDGTGDGTGDEGGASEIDNAIVSAIDNWESGGAALDDALMDAINNSNLDTSDESVLQNLANKLSEQLSQDDGQWTPEFSLCFLTSVLNGDLDPWNEC